MLRSDTGSEANQVYRLDMKESCQHTTDELFAGFTRVLCRKSEAMKRISKALRRCEWALQLRTHVPVGQGLLFEGPPRS